MLTLRSNVSTNFMKSSWVCNFELTSLRVPEGGVDKE
jgi:hypothetical protein